MACCSGPSTLLVTQQHSESTSTYLNIPYLVHGTRQVVHLLQKGPELSQGHLQTSYPVGTMKFHRWNFGLEPSPLLPCLCRDPLSSHLSSLISHAAQLPLQLPREREGSKMQAQSYDEGKDLAEKNIGYISEGGCLEIN